MRLWRSRQERLAAQEAEHVEAQKQSKERAAAQQQRTEQAWNKQLYFVRDAVEKGIKEKRRYVKVSQYSERFFLDALVAVANEDQRVRILPVSRTQTGADPSGGRYYTEVFLLELDLGVTRV